VARELFRFGWSAVLPASCVRPPFAVLPFVARAGRCAGGIADVVNDGWAVIAGKAVRVPNMPSRRAQRDALSAALRAGSRHHATVRCRGGCLTRANRAFTLEDESAGSTRNGRSR
jgi:hypothetical protein